MTVPGAAADQSTKVSPVNRKPNILFIMADQYRADCLGCDGFDKLTAGGNPVIKTPNLNRLAREGALFTRAYTSTPSCTPARAAILTGQSPWHHGMLAYGRIAEQYNFELPRAMCDAGYYTYAIGKLHYHPERNYHGFRDAMLDESRRAETAGFVSDYLKWFKEKAPYLDPYATGIGSNDYRAGEYALPEELHPTYWTGETAVSFIREYERDEPFFLNVSFARPHSPYDPPKKFFDMYKDGKMPPPHVGKWAEKYAPFESRENYSLWHGDLGIEQVRRSRRGYYGAITFIDEQIGLILKALEERKMLENTLILFTSDHGDMMGDHHLWRKSYAYEGSARIPMIIRWPKSMELEGERGMKISNTAELRDLLPTFLEAAGASIPESVDGMSMLQLIRGNTDGWREFIDLEHGVCYADENQWNALTDERWKYIYHSYDGSQQLFDLENDPGELNDLASDPSYTRTLNYWRRRLIKHFSERGEPFVVNGDLGIRREKILYSPNYPGK